MFKQSVLFLDKVFNAI